MQITNKQGLPGAIVEAIKNDDYTPGEKVDISVTSLLSPPRQVVLRNKHYGELVEDASDRIFALIGQAVHSILERAEPSAVVEERLYIEIEGWRIAGQFDRLTLRQATLQDFKMMSVWETMNGLKPEKTAQLNMLLQLAVENGYDNISNLEIVAIYRDWSKTKAKFDKKYPKSQVQRIRVDVWPEEKRLAYITERVRLHQEARVNLPECTAEERWSRPDKYAVMKKGRKSAVRLLDSQEGAEVYIQQKNVPQAHIVHRKGEDVRCDNYCAVKEYCFALREVKRKEFIKN